MPCAINMICDELFHNRWWFSARAVILLRIHLLGTMGWLVIASQKLVDMMRDNMGGVFVLPAPCIKSSRFGCS
jgi:hypothetical protein